MTKLAVGFAIVAMSVLPLAAQRGGGAAVQSAVPPAGGDPARGQALVESNKCLDCHRIRETGSRVGPSLSNIGAGRTAEQLAQSIVAPDDQVLAENRFVRITTKDGSTVGGHLLNQDAFTIQLLTDKEELKSYQKSSLREFTILDKGLMPSYAGKLTPQQID